MLIGHMTFKPSFIHRNVSPSVIACHRNKTVNKLIQSTQRGIYILEFDDSKSAFSEITATLRSAKQQNRGVSVHAYLFRVDFPSLFKLNSRLLSLPPHLIYLEKHAQYRGNQNHSDHVPATGNQAILTPTNVKKTSLFSKLKKVCDLCPIFSSFFATMLEFVHRLKKLWKLSFHHIFEDIFSS